MSNITNTFNDWDLMYYFPLFKDFEINSENPFYQFYATDEID
jgi:hypothetical protein